jgi:pimeloyl-ACP methyl ester carboxylesterase
MASARSEPPNDHLVWKSTEVEGRPALYGVAGEGFPLVFVHGWGLGQHAYKRALKRLVHLGCKVYAPALPGFGGSAELPAGQFDLDGYSAWLAGFVDAMDIAEPVFLVGHSFGGAVSIQFAHDHQERVRTLVLVNSVGGSAWSTPGAGGVVKSMAQRPLWDWGIHFPSDILPIPHLTRVLPVILEDAIPNLLRNPRAMWRAAQLARTADLTDELEELRRRRLPVVVLWGDQDRIIPRPSFDALCAAIGSEGEVVSGNHSWLLADPDSFGEVMTNIVAVADVARKAEDDRPAKRSRRPRKLAQLPGAKPGDELSA